LTQPTKKIIIVGAGNVAKALLFEINKAKIGCEVEIYNRTLVKAEALKDTFNFVKTVKSLSNISEAQGDVFVNLTHIGGRVTNEIFPEVVINRFEHVVDVTFENEQTDLIKKSLKLGKKIATGWDMFAYQAQVCIEGILNKTVEYDVLKKHVVAGLSETIK